MKVKDLIKELSEYNQEATVNVVVNSYGHDFEICMCGSEDCTKKDCDEVDLFVLDLQIIPIITRYIRNDAEVTN